LTENALPPESVMTTDFQRVFERRFPMAEQVYRVELLQQKIVALLRKHGTGITPAAIAQKLDLPLWAVNAGLEAAMVGDLVEFVSPDSYWIKAHAPHAAEVAL
jgi:hypothetical protein